MQFIVIMDFGIEQFMELNATSIYCIFWIWYHGFWETTIYGIKNKDWFMTHFIRNLKFRIPYLFFELMEMAMESITYIGEKRQCTYHLILRNIEHIWWEYTMMERDIVTSSKGIHSVVSHGKLMQSWNIM